MMNSFLRKTACITLVFFIWFMVAPDFIFAAGAADDLAKAEEMIKEMQYENAVNLINNYILSNQDTAGNASQVAKAHYLLAKIYYDIDEYDPRVKENLTKVFEYDENFTTGESSAGFSQLVEEARVQGKKKSTPVKETITHEKARETAPPRVIEKPVPKKKKKKFPVILLIGGVALVVALIVLLGKKKTNDEPTKGTITSVTVKFTVTFAGENLVTKHKIYVDGNQKFNQEVRFTKHYNENHVWDDFQHITKTFTIEKGLGQFDIQHEVVNYWDLIYYNENTWVGSTVYQLEVTNYTFANGEDPGMPSLSEYNFEFQAAPWNDDPADEWYRIKNKTITILSPSNTPSLSKSRNFGEKHKAISNKK